VFFKSLLWVLLIQIPQFNWSIFTRGYYLLTILRKLHTHNSTSMFCEFSVNWPIICWKNFYWLVIWARNEILIIIWKINIQNRSIKVCNLFYLFILFFTPNTHFIIVTPSGDVFAIFTKSKAIYASTFMYFSRGYLWFGYLRQLRDRGFELERLSGGVFIWELIGG
jgi:hypothetical protein